MALLGPGVDEAGSGLEPTRNGHLDYIGLLWPPTWGVREGELPNY